MRFLYCTRFLYSAVQWDFETLNYMSFLSESEKYFLINSFDSLRKSTMTVNIRKKNALQFYCYFHIFESVKEILFFRLNMIAVICFNNFFYLTIWIF